MAEMRMKCPRCKAHNVLVAQGLDGREMVECSSCRKSLGTWTELQSRTPKGLAQGSSGQACKNSRADGSLGV
jgi:transposase-like protein